MHLCYFTFLYVCVCVFVFRMICYFARNYEKKITQQQQKSRVCVSSGAVAELNDYRAQARLLAAKLQAAAQQVEQVRSIDRLM